jgi:hypothetical protein
MQQYMSYWNTTMNDVFYAVCAQMLWLKRVCKFIRIPCGGGVEYLHCSPASCTSRRKENSRIWESKIWIRIPRDSEKRMTALARTSINCKRQTRRLVRDSALH